MAIGVYGHVGSLLGQRRHPLRASSVVGPSAGSPWPVSVSCAAYLSRRHSSVRNVPFPPCAAPLGAAVRGGPRSTRRVPSPAHARSCSGCWPTPRSLDLSDAEYPVGTRPPASICPETSVLRFVRTTAVPVLAQPTRQGHAGDGVGEECYLVDPASSHMLVSKIKPCMCKYELIQTVKLRMAH